MMKILIACDMEGITGVTNWDQVDPTHAEYQRFRRLMTQDVNAAVRGAYDGGASEVIVTDGHAHGSNILIEELDPRARLNAGNSSPFAMVQGISGQVNAVFFIGYHARAGTRHAILDHTWSSKRLANLWLNDALIGEIGLNAALCGHFGVPVVFISADQSACAEASALLGNIETVAVKQATGRFSAECLPPLVSQLHITEGTARALHRLQAGDAPQPLRIQTPIRVAIDFQYSEHADEAAHMPGAERPEARRITFSAEDMPAAYIAFRAAVDLAFAA
jgi:D-amino peptidase